MAGGGREETAHVSDQDGRSGESCASRQQGSQESQTDVMSFFCGKLETCSSSISGSEKTQPAGKDAGFSPAGLSPVCVTDEGQIIRPVRSEGTARECKVV